MANIYSKFLSAQGAAFAWIGAWLGPLFALIGVVEESIGHLILGLAMITLPLFSITSYIKAAKDHVSHSDRVVYAIVPVLSLIGGAVLAVYLARGQ